MIINKPSRVKVLNIDTKTDSLFVRDDDGQEYWMIAKKFTRIEPDSIKTVIDYLNDCGNSDPHGLYYVAADRLSALIERGA